MEIQNLPAARVPDIPGSQRRPGLEADPTACLQRGQTVNDTTPWLLIASREDAEIRVIAGVCELMQQGRGYACREGGLHVLLMHVRYQAQFVTSPWGWAWSISQRRCSPYGVTRFDATWRSC